MGLFVYVNALDNEGNAETLEYFPPPGGFRSKNNAIHDLKARQCVEALIIY